MANHKSSEKRIRQTITKTTVNDARRSRIRTFVKKVMMAIANRDAPAAEAAMKDARPEIQRGVSKGVMPANTASRKISRLAQQIKKI